LAAKVAIVESTFCIDFHIQVLFIVAGGLVDASQKHRRAAAAAMDATALNDAAVEQLIQLSFDPGSSGNDRHVDIAYRVH
jgi:hypothetical protein